MDITRYPRIAARVLLKRANLSFVLMYVITDAYGDNIKRRARRAGGPCCQMKNMKFPGAGELHSRGQHYWTGLGLGWIRTMPNFVESGLDPDCKLLYEFRIRTELGLSKCERIA